MQWVYKVIILVISLVHLSKTDNCTITSFEQVKPVLANCKNVVIGDLLVPGGVPLEIFAQDDTTITVKGNVSFQHYPWTGPLIQINSTRLTMVGEAGSVFYGFGEKYWDSKGEWGTPKPRFARITSQHSKFLNLTFVNSPRHFIGVDDSNYLYFDNLLLNNFAAGPAHILTKYSGHNTDGFDIGNSTYIEITNTQVFNQDDCIAISSGHHMHISKIFCHGGLGLAINGGAANDSVPNSVHLNTVKNITFEDSTLVNIQQQVVHIRTLVDGGNGSIDDVTYRNIRFDMRGKSALVFQQNYRNVGPGHPANATTNIPKGNVPITNLKLINIIGSISATTGVSIPIDILCAQNACADWTVENVKIFTALSFHNKCKNFKPKGILC